MVYNLFKSFISLIIFLLIVLSITDREMLKIPATHVDLSLWKGLKMRKKKKDILCLFRYLLLPVLFILLCKLIFQIFFLWKHFFNLVFICERYFCWIQILGWQFCSLLKMSLLYLLTYTVFNETSAIILIFLCTF